MNVVIELHPEELIDAEARGAISCAEAEALGAHCARCAACRFERRLRTDFARALLEVHEASGESLDERGTLHVELPREDADRESGLQYGGPQATSRREAWWFGRKVVGWMAIAGLLVATAHGASALVAVEEVGGVRQAHQAATPRTARGEDAARHRAPAQKVAMRPAPRPARAPDSAATLFDEANRARVHGDYDRALARYKTLQSAYPASRETQFSYVSMGRMQLDRADAAGALATFDRFGESSDEELEEVVMAGRALALDELGSESAPLAWAVLLDTHPDTPYAEHARLRVNARSM